jgi:hypothetical protein
VKGLREKHDVELCLRIATISPTRDSQPGKKRCRKRNRRVSFPAGSKSSNTPPHTAPLIPKQQHTPSPVFLLFFTGDGTPTSPFSGRLDLRPGDLPTRQTEWNTGSNLQSPFSIQSSLQVLRRRALTQQIRPHLYTRRTALDLERGCSWNSGIKPLANGYFVEVEEIHSPGWLPSVPAIQCRGKQDPAGQWAEGEPCLRVARATIKPHLDSSIFSAPVLQPIASFVDPLRIL